MQVHEIWLGYCPFFCTWSRYSALYRDTRRTGARMARQDTAEHACDTASRPPRYGRPARGACNSARTHGLARGKSRYNGLYHGLGRPLCCNGGNDTGCDTAPSAMRHGAGALRHVRYGARQGLGSGYNFCIVTGRGDDTAACARVQAATRRSTRHDTAPNERCARSLGVVQA